MSHNIVKIQKYATSVCIWLSYVSFAGFVLLILLTFCDVVGTKVFKWPFPYVIDGTSFLCLVIIAFALAFTQAQKKNVEIEFFTERLPKNAQFIISTIISFISLALVATVSWQMFDFARNTQISGILSQTEKIPVSPFIYATAVCFSMLSVMILLQFIQSLAKGTKQ